MRRVGTDALPEAESATAGVVWRGRSSRSCVFDLADLEPRRIRWIIGLFLVSTNLVLVGAVLFSAVLLFQIVTLPVEFKASNRAKALIVEHGIVTSQERDGVDRVLNAAALTYVAAAVSTLLTLLYFLWRAGLFGGRR